MTDPWYAGDRASPAGERWSSLDDAGQALAGVALEGSQALAAVVAQQILAGVATEVSTAPASTLSFPPISVNAGVATEADAAPAAQVIESIEVQTVVEIQRASALDPSAAHETDVALPATVALETFINAPTVVEVSTIPPFTVEGDVTTTPVLAFSGDGQLALEEEEFEIYPEFRVEILDPVIERGPTNLTVTVAGGLPETEAEFWLDDVLVWTTSLDAAGGLSPSSIGIYAGAGADVGTHELEVRQVYFSTQIETAATYEVLRPPITDPVVQGLDNDPVEVPGAVTHNTRHWVLQDGLPATEGGLGSYILPINPREMSSPQLEHVFSSRRTTAKAGQFHVFQVGKVLPEWKFSGYAPTQEMVDKLLAFRRINRRFWLIDHHNRAWKVIFLNVDLKARLQHNFNGVATDWGHDYEVTALVLDQEWWEPV